ncbi:unnamed protein product [Camellia sinensis]
MVMMAATAVKGAASTALRAVLHRVRQAPERSGRIADDVRVVAVSKTKPISLIRQVYDSGHRCFGENYVQEIIEKAPQLPEDIDWHFVGHLQSNKVKSLLAKDCVPQFTTLSLARSKVMQSTLVAEGLALVRPHYLKGHLESYQLPIGWNIIGCWNAIGERQNMKLLFGERQNGISLAGTLLAVSPVSPVMAPIGTAQAVAKELLNSILDAVVRIFEKHVIVGELLESKSSQQSDTNTPKSMAEINWNPDSDASHDTGGYSIGFSLTVLQATLEAASADAAVQTARLANKAPSKEKRQLARALGLQPRQIAIWFQNRRARWKTKQLQKDYNVLKRQFDAIKADNDTLQSQN